MSSAREFIPTQSDIIQRSAFLRANHEYRELKEPMDFDAEAKKQLISEESESIRLSTDEKKARLELFKQETILLSQKIELKKAKAKEINDAILQSRLEEEERLRKIRENESEFERAMRESGSDFEKNQAAEAARLARQVAEFEEKMRLEREAVEQAVQMQAEAEAAALAAQIQAEAAAAKALEQAKLREKINAQNLIIAEKEQEAAKIAAIARAKKERHDAESLADQKLLEQISKMPAKERDAMYAAMHAAKMAKAEAEAEAYEADRRAKKVAAAAVAQAELEAKHAEAAAAVAQAKLEANNAHAKAAASATQPETESKEEAENNFQYAQTQAVSYQQIALRIHEVAQSQANAQIQALAEYNRITELQARARQEQDELDAEFGPAYNAGHPALCDEFEDELEIVRELVSSEPLADSELMRVAAQGDDLIPHALAMLKEPREYGNMEDDLANEKVIQSKLKEAEKEHALHQKIMAAQKAEESAAAQRQAEKAARMEAYDKNRLARLKAIEWNPEDDEIKANHNQAASSAASSSSSAPEMGYAAGVQCKRSYLKVDERFLSRDAIGNYSVFYADSSSANREYQAESIDTVLATIKAKKLEASKALMESVRNFDRLKVNSHLVGNKGSLSSFFKLPWSTSTGKERLIGAALAEKIEKMIKVNKALLLERQRADFMCELVSSPLFIKCAKAAEPKRYSAASSLSASSSNMGPSKR